MNKVAVPLVVALLLFAAGALAWTLGEAEERTARVKAQIATLDFRAVADGTGDTAAAEPDDNGAGSLSYAERVPQLGERIRNEVRSERSTAAYWLRRFDELSLERDAGGALLERDPGMLLLAANAAFRASQLESADRETALARLESIVRNYADVLKSDAANDALDDAAFNYELAARLRSGLERARNATLPPRPADVKPPTIHGWPGAPPKDADPNQFKVVIPRRSDERSAEPEGGQGQDRLRKG
jgi:hypothetical protein